MGVGGWGFGDKLENLREVVIQYSTDIIYAHIFMIILKIRSYNSDAYFSISSWLAFINSNDLMELTLKCFIKYVYFISRQLLLYLIICFI